MTKNKDEDRIKEQQVTYDIYAAMPDDGQRYEIVDGVLELMCLGPMTVHQTVSGELSYILKQSCKSDYIFFTH
ncbi:Uma2 family endonuclease [Cohnella herbarum]|uniref:Uma2 family endonuclease n=1 Tax=Cohnella herbarum TaxID=2728023 RepID=UPI001C2C84B3|nr:Uma2 family endonuclease [Cohnella herbarum]